MAKTKSIRVSFRHEGKVVRLSPNAHPKQGSARLYCSCTGICISVSKRGINPIKGSYRPDRCPNTHGGGVNYLDLPSFNDIPVHIAVYEAWYGQRTPGMQIDHINGNPRDNRAVNLEQVTPEENMRRRRILNALRKNGLHPERMSIKRLKIIFAEPLVHIPGQLQIDRELSRHAEI